MEVYSIYLGKLFKYIIIFLRLILECINAGVVKIIKGIHVNCIIGMLGDECWFVIHDCKLNLTSLITNMSCRQFYII